MFVYLVFIGCCVWEEDESDCGLLRMVFSCMKCFFVGLCDSLGCLVLLINIKFLINIFHNFVNLIL
jgi:hypothetical protein